MHVMLRLDPASESERRLTIKRKLRNLKVLQAEQRHPQECFTIPSDLCPNVGRYLHFYDCFSKSAELEVGNKAVVKEGKCSFFACNYYDKGDV